MKQHVIDLIALAGFIALMAGAYLHFGLEVTLMAGGFTVIVLSLIISRQSGVKPNA